MTSLATEPCEAPAFAGGGQGTPSLFLLPEAQLRPLLAALARVPSGRHSEPYMRHIGNCEALTPGAIRLICGLPAWGSANGEHTQGVVGRIIKPEPIALRKAVARWIGRRFHKQINWLGHRLDRISQLGL